MWKLNVALLITGCSAAGATDDVAHVQDSRVPFQISVDAELADAASQALALWADATDNAYAPALGIGGAGRFHISQAPVTECNGGAVPAGMYAWGCVDARGVVISPDTPADKLVTVIAHELGHTLGLLDTTDRTLMNSGYASKHPGCVQAELVSEAGFTGPGACL